VDAKGDFGKKTLLIIETEDSASSVVPVLIISPSWVVLSKTIRAPMRFSCIIPTAFETSSIFFSISDAEPSNN
jgi:hypothetical protein